MSQTGTYRPDPEQLLRRLGDSGQRRRGRFRIYFGASAGVGKTYTMLEAAQALRGQGLDLVVGVVETHGRKETAALLEGLPTLPPRNIAHRGRRLQEFDLDAALTRAPALILVDELAHSNAPGSRHAKRWQDVQELLAAGIDVWATLNVQHLDSLNEAVGGITGVRVGETVPDDVFDAADEVILVDVPAEELLYRLSHGKVYIPEQARHAAGHFFRKGNLIALRELALRRTAEHVDEDVQEYRLDRAIHAVWRTREAVVACIADDGDAEYVVRSAHQLTQQLDCDLHVVTMEPPRVVEDSAIGQGTPQAAMALAESLGACTETLAGGDMIATLTRYVRRHNITKVLLGRHRGRTLARPSFNAMLSAALRPGWMVHRRSFADLLSAACPDVDVIRVGAPSSPPPVADRLPRGRSRHARRAEAGSRASPEWPGYAWALTYCAIAAGLSTLAFPFLREANIVMLFLLAVVLVALRHGRGPAALASVVSVALFDFLFVQPLDSFAVADLQYLLTFMVLLGVGLLIGQLTAGLRRQAQASVRRETDVRGLYEFARDLSSALTAEQIVRSARAYLRAAFSAGSALYILDAGDRLGLAPADAQSPEGVEPALAQWVFDHGEPAGAGTATLSSSRLLYLPLRGPMRMRGVLAVEAPDDKQFDRPPARRQVDACARLIAIALERLHFVEVAQRALVSVESEKLRNSLLAAVSHDLRTPLTTLIGTSENLLRRPDALDSEALDAVRAMHDQARRMYALVVNLLDMARL